MSRKTLRMFMCAAVAAALGMFGTATQATFYAGDFDPPGPGFTGHFLLDVTCPDNCIVDLVSLDITTSTTFGPGWIFAGPEQQIASNPSFEPSLHFLSDVILLSMPEEEWAGLDHLNDGCNAPSVMFTPNPGVVSGFVANLGCFDGNTFVSGDTATYIATVVPEPGTLVLLVGGIGAAWLTRRRKTIA